MTRRAISNADALYYLRYGVCVVLELWAAHYLLSHAASYHPIGTWLAYFFISTSGLALVFGFVLYLAWARERQITGWYIATLLSLVGVGTLAATQWVQMSEPILIVGLLGILGLPIYSIGFGLLRIFQFLKYRAFKMLLNGISQIGAAWRGELRT